MATDFAHDLVALVDIGEAALLVGEPGIGKSLTARRAFQILANRFNEDPSNVPFPILISLGEHDSAAGTPNDLDPLHLEKLVVEVTGLSERDIRWLAKGRRFVLLLDALDESSYVGGSLEQVRKALSAPLFDTVRLLTTRADYFSPLSSLAAIHQRFRLVARLEPLPFDENIRSFVVSYCGRFRVGRDAEILRLLEEHEGLRDLAARPLTLWMVVDLLAIPPSEAPSDPRDLNLTSLYRGYTGKWLRIETTKTEARIVGVEDRLTLVRHAARAMFQMGIALGGSMRSTAELAISRDQLADALAGDKASTLVRDLVSRVGLGVVVDEVCSRTFLVQRSQLGNYRFAHKSFFEYFVALDLRECIGSARQIDIARSYFERPLSDPIIYFFREMLAEDSSRRQVRRIISQAMFELFDESHGAMDIASVTVRQHVGNLIPSVLDNSSEADLTARLDAEPSEFVRRGITVGLALQRDRRDLVDAYVARLETDSSAASIHVGYTRVYHGDQEWNKDWTDDGTRNVERTIEAQIDRLVSERNRHLNERLWSLTLFTVRLLIEDGRAADVFEQDHDALEALRQFVTVRREEQGTQFERQRAAVSQLLSELPRK